MQPKSITLLQKVDTIVEQLLLKFQDIFEVLKNDNKPKELLAVESLTIENNAIQIIRLCQDMLSILRSLKETWILQTLKVRNTGNAYNTSNNDINGTNNDIKDQRGCGEWNEEESQKVFNLFNELTERIAKFESPQFQSI